MTELGLFYLGVADPSLSSGVKFRNRIDRIVHLRVMRGNAGMRWEEHSAHRCECWSKEAHNAPWGAHYQH